MHAGTVFLSVAVGPGRLAPAGAALGRAVLGRATPGWAVLSAAYAGSLAACGWGVKPVLRPEIYGTAQARTVLGIQPGDWHLGIKPVEHLRPFPGLRNAFVCDWPFPELSSAVLGGSPFFDQLRVLRGADAVLCTNGFTTDTLRRAGIEHAVTLPPVVAPRPGERDGDGFLCVVDAGSLPRQLGPTLEGFARAVAVRAGLRLTVRLRGGDATALADLRRQAAAAGSGNGVSVVPDGERHDGEEHDGEEHDGAGYDAPFFLSAHAAPGLHLPLAEAMASGCIPVATLVAGTAWAVPPGAAVPIATRPELLDGDGEPIGRFLPLTSNKADAVAVRDAVLLAAALDGATRRRMAEAVRAAAAERFGLSAFRDGLLAALPGVPG